MLNKKIIFMAILLISLLSLSAVSAADDAASDIASAGDDAIIDESITEDVSNEEPILEESDENVLTDDGEEWSEPAPNPPSLGDFVLLNQTVNEGNDVIDLYDDYSYMPNSEEDVNLQHGITINHNVTINGNGHKINGESEARIFIIPENVNVIFKNINFYNANAPGEWACGGAIWVETGGEATVINCNFTNNRATYEGAAICGDCTAINCTFTGNIVESPEHDYQCSGGAIAYGSAKNCNFENNHAYNGGAICDGNAINCTFTQNSANGVYGSGGAMYYGNAINCNFTQNNAEYGGAMAYASAENCNFENNEAPRAGAIYNTKATNCNFTGNIASEEGGAMYYGSAENCIFNGNSAFKGGAMYNGQAINCNFNDNYAEYGGAMYDSEATNCTFNKNNAEYGGAMNYGAATKCTFTDNKATYQGGAIRNGTAVNCIFTGNEANFGGAMCCDMEINDPCYAANCTFINNHAGTGGAIYIGNAVNCTFTGNNAELYGGAMAGEGIPCSAVNCIFTDNIPYYQAIYKGIADTCIFNGNDIPDDVDVLQPTFTASNFISTYNDGTKLVFNLTTNSGMHVANANIKVDVYKTTGEFVGTYNVLSGGWKVPLNAGSYIAYYNATDFDINNAEGMIVVNKAKTAITAKAINATYNVNKNLTITLKDSNGKALSKVKVTVTIGSTTKTYTTDKNGKIKINVANKVPKTYTVKIKYAGNANYIASSKSVKVVVKKATPKITAKAKTFKVKVKTKKYTITLKNNKNKVMKNTKVTLKVNKKTFTAKTNSKGVATFKITNLKKKGTYKAVIKYAGSKYYKALSKKATITVKIK